MQVILATALRGQCWLHSSLMGIAAGIPMLLSSGAFAELQLPGDMGPYAVGHLKTLQSEDSSLTGTLYLWYPVDTTDAVGATRTQYTLDGLLFPSEYAFDGVPTATPGAFPSIVYFHGSGAWGAQQPSMAETLASFGFVVAGMTNNRDATSMLDKLASLSADPQHVLYEKVDSTRAGLVGLSRGGTNTLEHQNEPRVQAIMPISPGSSTSPAQIHSISDRPMFVMSGTLDHTLDTSRALFDNRQAGDRQLAVIDRAGHVSYADWCNRIEYADANYGPNSIPGIRAFAHEACQPQHIPNQQAIDLTNFYATAFFGRHVQGEESYQGLLTPEYAAANSFPLDTLTTARGLVPIRPLAPTAAYEVWDQDFDGIGDVVRNVSTGGGVGDVGERETRTRRWLSRLVTKFRLPDDPRTLKSATLQFLLQRVPEKTDEAVSIWHSPTDNRLEPMHADFEAAAYHDTQLDLVGALDAPQLLYEVDVTSQVLTDYVEDAGELLSAFRLQVDQELFTADGENDRYSFDMPSLQGSGPRLVLTFVPEPTSCVLVVVGLLAVHCCAVRGQRQDQSMSV